MLYFSLASTSFKGPDGVFNVKLLNIYWRYFKWALIYTFITLFIGVVALFNAIQGLCACVARIILPASVADGPSAQI